MVQDMLRRLLSVATVLTLVLFAASAGLEPDTALAQPGCEPSGGQPPKCDDGGNNNGGDNGGDNENRNGDNDREDNDGNGGNGGAGGTGTGIFVNICALPWFAPNPGCALGLFGG